MKKSILFLVVLVAAFAWFRQVDHRPAPAIGGNQGVASATATFGHADSGREVVGQGVVSRVLPDDTRGLKHQRFILRLPSGQTVLVAHDISLAPRIPGLHPGQTVGFKGVFVWNRKGGIIHWTHADPDGSHAAGWLKVGGRTFQ